MCLTITIYNLEKQCNFALICRYLVGQRLVNYDRELKQQQMAAAAASQSERPALLAAAAPPVAAIQPN